MTAEHHFECMLHTLNTAGIRNIGSLDMLSSSKCHIHIYGPTCLKTHSLIANTLKAFFGRFNEYFVLGFTSMPH